MYYERLGSKLLTIKGLIRAMSSRAYAIEVVTKLHPIRTVKGQVRQRGTFGCA